MNIELNVVSETDATSVTLRGQSDSDVARVRKFCPIDQKVQCVGEWTDNNRFVFSKVEAAKVVADDPVVIDPAVTPLVDAPDVTVSQLSEADFETLAAEHGLTFHHRESRETKNKKLAKALDKKPE